MKKTIMRFRLAWWAFRNPDRLTMLHFELLRERQRNGNPYAALYLRDIPGARENEAAL